MLQLLTWPAARLVQWNKRKYLHKNRVQFPEGWPCTPIWPPFLCFCTPTWPPWRHVKTIYFDQIFPGDRSKRLISLQVDLCMVYLWYFVRLQLSQNLLKLCVSALRDKLETRVARKRVVGFDFGDVATNNFSRITWSNMPVTWCVALSKRLLSFKETLGRCFCFRVRSCWAFFGQVWWGSIVAG